MTAVVAAAAAAAVSSGDQLAKHPYELDLSDALKMRWSLDYNDEVLLAEVSYSPEEVGGNAQGT